MQGRNDHLLLIRMTIFTCDIAPTTLAGEYQKPISEGTYGVIEGRPDAKYAKKKIETTKQQNSRVSSQRTPSEPCMQ